MRFIVNRKLIWPDLHACVITLAGLINYNNQGES
jgi:hypothetical protein